VCVCVFCGGACVIRKGLARSTLQRLLALAFERHHKGKKVAFFTAVVRIEVACLWYSFYCFAVVGSKGEWCVRGRAFFLSVFCCSCCSLSMTLVSFDSETGVKLNLVLVTVSVRVACPVGLLSQRLSARGCQRVWRSWKKGQKRERIQVTMSFLR
jgi:hypothetical protein